VLEIDALDGLVEPDEPVEDVEAVAALDDSVADVETTEALDDPVSEVTGVEVVPVKLVPAVVVDVRTVVPAKFYKVKCTNSSETNESTHLL